MLFSELIIDVCKSTGIVLDTVYCGKGVYEMIKELQCNKASFKGNNILFIHTGAVRLSIILSIFCLFYSADQWLMFGPKPSFYPVVRGKYCVIHSSYTLYYPPKESPSQTEFK